MEKADYAANAEARAMAHQARSIDNANWPIFVPGHVNVYYLNDCRNLSNDLADAALYEHLQGNDAAAIETLRDQMHLADMLEIQTNQTLVRFLVGIGIRAEIYDRLKVITSGVALTKDPADTKKLQTSVARELITQLVNTQDTQADLENAMRAEGANMRSMTKPNIDRLIETTNRVNAERGLTAMSLACHLYRFDTGHWPESLDDLSAYLPQIPIDPFGDGKQTLGYALIKRGLPDGQDRPLVYSRWQVKDGLFFRTDIPAYSFYIGDGSHRPANKQKQGGQFRDVVSWAPEAGTNPAPTTRPLE
jgi:hypothetical protein